jgi:hypothetical protein
MPYTNSPSLAWAGWRYRIQGGPIGGQYHGFIAPDETVDYQGWPAGPREMFRPMDDPRGLGVYPWEHWNKHVWGGTAYMEGQSPSDFVYRGPAEVRPRPNASGGVNTVRAVQQRRTAGFAVAPGNYKTLGAAPMVIATPAAGGGLFHGAMPVDPWVAHAGPDNPELAYLLKTAHPVCPAWGCGGPPRYLGPPDHIPAPSPAPVVTQPPPPTGPQPWSTVPIGPAGSDGCAQGQYRDAAGNCTSDWHNPYPMFLPLDSAAQPSPVVSANTCPTGYAQDGNGNCVVQCPAGETVDAQGNCLPPTASGITGWLESSTQLPLIGSVPNWGIVAVLGLVAMRMGGGRRR